MKRTTTHSTAFKIGLTLSIMLIAAGQGLSAPQLQDVSFDPGVISAGDRVDITTSIHYEVYDEVGDEMNINISLKPENRLAEKYVTIEDVNSDSIFIYPGGGWNQQFQVKVHGDAPSGNYRFTVKITETGQSSSITYEEEFVMPVEKEGVDLTADVVKNSPNTPRAGDNDVKLDLRVSNTGNKDIEEIKIVPEFPNGFSSSNSMTEKILIDRISKTGSSQEELSVDLKDDLRPGVYWINLSTIYEDTESNSYSEKLEIPLRVEGRPDLKVVNSSMEMKTGSTAQLELTILNTGSQDAEAVSARVIAQRSQPFSLADRSSYIGEIKPGENGKAVLSISADRSATLKAHQLKIELRANGDSEEDDNSVYTFTENVDVKLDNRARSPLIYLGTAAALLLLAAGLFRYFNGEKDSEGGKQSE